MYLFFLPAILALLTHVIHLFLSHDSFFYWITYSVTCLLVRLVLYKACSKSSVLTLDLIFVPIFLTCLLTLLISCSILVESLYSVTYFVVAGSEE